MTDTTASTIEHPTWLETVVQRVTLVAHIAIEVAGDRRCDPEDTPEIDHLRDKMEHLLDEMIEDLSDVLHRLGQPEGAECRRLLHKIPPPPNARAGHSRLVRAP